MSINFKSKNFKFGIRFTTVTAMLVIVFFAPVNFMSPLTTCAAQRDNLTATEADRVRDARDIERRVDAFIKVAERRLLALTDPQAAQSRQVQRDMEQWGELPTGTRLQLLSDLAQTLNEAITNIEDAATRPGTVAEQGTRALRKLSEASSRFLTQLTPMRAGLSEESPEREQLERAIQYAQEIVAAMNTTNRSDGS